MLNKIIKKSFYTFILTRVVLKFKFNLFTESLTNCKIHKRYTLKLENENKIKLIENIDVIIIYRINNIHDSFKGKMVTVKSLKINHFHRSSSFLFNYFISSVEN